MVTLFLLLLLGGSAEIILIQIISILETLTASRKLLNTIDKRHLTDGFIFTLASVVQRVDRNVEIT